MNVQDITSIREVNEFLDGTQAVMFEVLSDKDERNAWIQTTLVKFRYTQLSRADKGVVTRFIIKVAGISAAQTKRLIRQYKNTGKVKRSQRTTNGFPRKYTARDIVLLAEMDELHGARSGPILKKLCERMYELFGDERFKSLSKISVSHLYNLRNSERYHRQRRHFEKTKPRASSIGERRKPNPNGSPGYLRVDTVHQGDQDGVKGVYHINAVDEVTQFECVVSVERISEAYLVPALKYLIDWFPFEIKGFHTDNGSEYINNTVAKILCKLRVEFTKSRSRKSNDNAHVESKNGSIVRKALGYEHIAQGYANLINEFHEKHLNPYINFHKPCFFPQVVIDKKGRETKKYPYELMMTPYEKLKSLPNAQGYLKEDMNFDLLDQVAFAMNDNQVAEKMNKARSELFSKINKKEKQLRA